MIIKFAKPWQLNCKGTPYIVKLSLPNLGNCIAKGNPISLIFTWSSINIAWSKKNKKSNMIIKFAKPRVGAIGHPVPISQYLPAGGDYV